MSKYLSTEEEEKDAQTFFQQMEGLSFPEQASLVKERIKENKSIMKTNSFANWCVKFKKEILEMSD